ncbi:MAG: hypothetical protein Q9182_005457 [Xanthomendoza sp. 2 TL-2023]
MPEDTTKPRAKPAAPRLVQSKLTDMFGAIKVSGTKSPHFPIQNPPTSPPNTKDNDTPVNLHPNRRANLKTTTPSLPTSKRSEILAAIAQETLDVLPDVLKSTPNARPTSQLLEPHTLAPAHPTACPTLPKTKIRVLNMDTLDAAHHLNNKITASTVSHSPSTSPPTLILNMANAKWAGGGWLAGARAQEESLCYRSSLYLTLKHRYYPMPNHAAIYSPRVLIIRESAAHSHRLLDLGKPDALPVVSVVSMAAIRDPPVLRRLGDGREIYAAAADREMMRDKIRMVLRVAAAKGHRQLVLGALGCGAFGNPRGEVARLWRDVLLEPEFSGGWWEDVVFAVLDGSNEPDAADDSNYGVFYRDLHGLAV